MEDIGEKWNSFYPVKAKVRSRADFMENFKKY